MEKDGCHLEEVARGLGNERVNLCLQEARESLPGGVKMGSFGFVSAIGYPFVRLLEASINPLK